VVKILFESKLPLELMPLVDDVPGLAAFMKDRVEFYLKDVLGFAYDEVAACVSAGVGTLADLAERVRAVHTVRPTADFEPLAASFKRIKNILRQAGFTSASQVDAEKLVPGPEKELFEAFTTVRQHIKKTAGYGDALTSIASLRPKVDLFFDKILVNDPDPVIRQNRLAMLHSLLTEFSTIADFSEIVTQGASA
jgi:glycyl-tRNA synthetase beta chain